MRTARDDYEGGNMGARLMDDTRETTRAFKQGEVTLARHAPVPAPEHRAVVIARELLAGLAARKQG